MQLTKKTMQVVEKMFPPNQQEEAIQLLANDCGTNLLGVSGSAEGLERIRLAVLRLSQGYLDELVLYIVLAQTDWRDALVFAGFGSNVNEHHIWAEEYLTSDEHWSQPNPRNHAMEAEVFETNWVKCPRCGWKFCLSDLSSWTGERHRRCKQRIQLIYP